MAKAWMVRAEQGGRLFDMFRDNNIVAIGWAEIGDLSGVKSRKSIAERFAVSWPNAKPQGMARGAGQLHRFVNEMAVGDLVVTYDPSRRAYLIGEIAGEYRFDTSFDAADPQVRPVRWKGEVSRDLLSVASRNSLGAISTFFLLSRGIVNDLQRALTSGEPAKNETVAAETDAVEEDLFHSMEARALEFIKDKVNALDWEDM